MKQSTVDFSRVIEKDELDRTVNNAYIMGTDIYTIQKNQVILTNNDTELTITYNNKSDLFSLLDEFFAPQIYINDIYDNILLIDNYENDIVEKEYVFSKRNKILDNKLIIICYDIDVNELVEEYLSNYEYVQINCVKKSNLKFILKR